jgi:hypothetical protein
VSTQNDQDPEDLDAAAELVELPRDADDLPPIDFSTFVVSLRASAMLHLGSSREGGSSESIDLALARQEIDLLGILEDKTRGNLSGEEERLLSQILFDLRTRYLAVREHCKGR